MKKLTTDEFAAAPKDVQEIFLNVEENRPVDPTQVKLAVQNYPEYFPQEVAFNKLWENVPQTVRTRYMSELSKYERKELLSFKLKIKKLFRIEAQNNAQIAELPVEDRETYNRILQVVVDKVEKYKQGLYTKHFTPYFLEERKSPLSVVK